MTDSASKINPGHGPLADKAQLQAYRNMRQTAYTRLLSLRNQGLSVEDAVAQKALADLEERWSKGIFTGDKWISIVYSVVN